MNGKEVSPQNIPLVHRENVIGILSLIEKDGVKSWAGFDYVTLIFDPSTNPTPTPQCYEVDLAHLAHMREWLEEMYPDKVIYRSYQA